MDCEEYSCTVSSHAYTIREAVYRISYLQPHIVDIVHHTNHIQCIVYLTPRKTVVSYTSTTQSSDSEIVRVLYSYLKLKKYPVPVFETIHPSPAFNHVRSYSFNEYIVFYTASYAFRAYISDERYHYAVKVGGRDFNRCVEIMIDKPNNMNKLLPKLAQVYSEPECWRNLGKRGDTVDMIKGAMQLCQMLFGVDSFRFDDNSNIDCEKRSNVASIPPRKLYRPFSLAHLYLATKGKTWYEYNFDARIADKDEYNKYKIAVSNLSDPVKKLDTTFDVLLARSRMNEQQRTYLQPLFEMSGTWLEFFRRVPKSQQCEMLFNWMPSFMNNYILDFDPNRHEWIIQLGQLDLLENGSNDGVVMTRTAMHIETAPSASGGRALRKRNRSKTRHNTSQNGRKPTRKSRIVISDFSNYRVWGI